MKQYEESAALQFCGLFHMSTVEGPSETVIFKHLTNHSFRCL